MIRPDSFKFAPSESASIIKDRSLQFEPKIFIWKPFFGVNTPNFFDADLGSGMEKIRIRDEKKFGSGIRENHPGSATQYKRTENLIVKVFFASYCFYNHHGQFALEVQN
jgi:hypothetical protein